MEFKDAPSQVGSLTWRRDTEEVAGLAEKPNARKWAREVTTRLLAEQASVLRANESDLAEFQKQHGRWERAAQRRDAAVAAAETRYRDSAAAAEAAAGAALGRLQTRGMGEAQLSAITGLGVMRVRRLLRRGRLGDDSSPDGVGFEIDECGLPDGAAERGQSEEPGKHRD